MARMLKVPAWKVCILLNPDTVLHKHGIEV